LINSGLKLIRLKPQLFSVSNWSTKLTITLFLFREFKNFVARENPIYRTYLKFLSKIEILPARMKYIFCQIYNLLRNLHSDEILSLFISLHELSIWKIDWKVRTYIWLINHFDSVNNSYSLPVVNYFIYCTTTYLRCFLIISLNLLFLVQIDLSYKQVFTLWINCFDVSDIFFI